MKDKDILDLLGLTDRKINLTLEDDLNYIIDNGMDVYLKKEQEYNDKKQEFINMFKDCYDDLCVFMEQDPKQRVAISCFTCQNGIDLRKQYGKPKKK